MVYCTYLGSVYDDSAKAIAADDLGNAYVTGYCGGGFPIKNPIQDRVYGGTDAFVTKINPQGTDLVYSTYLGGSSYSDGGVAIAIDSQGSCYVAGETWSYDFPLVNPIQKQNRSGRTVFVSQVNSAGNALLFSTFWGGVVWDGQPAIAVNRPGEIHVAGLTTSSDFPIRNPLYPYRGNEDMFVSCIKTFDSSNSALQLLLLD